MAKATSQTVTRELVTLEMSSGEAKTLLDITTAIAGDPETSRRGHTDAIHRALINLYPGERIRPDDMSGSITFSPVQE